MQTVSVEELSSRIQSLPPNPRIVVSGNMAIPWDGVKVIDQALPEYILHALNAPPGLPEREGVTVETCFVGAGMRRHPG
ncbi:MAG TPA: acetyl-CoA hydrolase, partial [Intrasporangium sp.]|nr:acetyl-CoA hydrolase [Intrasporangium sp.]